MSQTVCYPALERAKQHSYLTESDYQTLYQQSIEQPDSFWAEQAKRFISWYQTWDKVSDNDLTQGQVRWFINGKLNVSYNCIDRHLPTRAKDTAIIFEQDEPGKAQHISYQELHDKVCQLSHLLKSLGINKGDRVCLYMPMIPEAVYAMLACTRIGAVHSVVFAGFSPNALKDRLQDCQAKLLITADESLRGGKSTALKANADSALADCPEVKHCLVVKHTQAPIVWQEGRDIDYHTASQNLPTHFEPEVMDSEDPLFILYTSGSTGKPKGVLHSTGGYLLGASITHHYVFDYHPGEVYWCTADIGWITGHSYIVYGPLCNGATTILFESTPTYPDASRCWQVIDEHQVAVFYTAPTAIRALMAMGDEFLAGSSRQSLRLLGSVGEPINPEAWHWYYHQVGQARCPIVDTWWQTETGNIMISPLPSISTLKPSAATRPFFGIKPVLLDDSGQPIEGAGQGNLAFKQSWPSQIRTVYGNHQRLIDTYYSQYAGYYFSGDGARRDDDGDYWITGRVDDVLNVSGHRLGTAEIESALALHHNVTEAAVVGFPHPIKGEAVYAYVVTKDGQHNDELKQALNQLVSKAISPIAKPDCIQWASDLPKTRSGKIMRRILRKIADNQVDDIGDTSTLANPAIVSQLIEQRINR